MQKKNASPHKVEASVTRQGASIVATNAFPSKLSSLRAAVLAHLLNNERLTSLDAVVLFSTTRLAAITHDLSKHYNWTILATYKAAGCRDGRVSWVAEYALPADSIAQAMQCGAVDWCQRVQTARKLQRMRAAEAQRKARQLNAKKRPAATLQQLGLFDGERA